MRARPRSNWVNGDGLVNFAKVGEVPEFPEVLAWDKEFTNECDRLAEVDAHKTGKTHWGRWRLTKQALITRTIRPRIDGDKGKPLYVGTYDIPLDDLDRGEGQQTWVEHMEEKNWLGEKGLRDLAVAIEALTMRRVTEVIADG